MEAGAYELAGQAPQRAEPQSRRARSRGRGAPAEGAGERRARLRRALDERIAEGEIRINGTTAIVGQVVKAGDRVELDGKAFVAVPTSRTRPRC
jgi:23S rRNA pseudouridine2605 synthase